MCLLIRLFDIQSDWMIEEEAAWPAIGPAAPIKQKARIREGDREGSGYW